MGAAGRDAIQPLTADDNLEFGKEAGSPKGALPTLCCDKGTALCRLA
jgi:hypothetical protein